VSRSRGTAVVTALLFAALAIAGCGFGAGADVGKVKLTVTREFGAVPMLQRSLEVNESDTVMRLLEGSAEISTRYGGGYVGSIDGVEERERDGHPSAWFFFVDGIESPIGAADYVVNGRERIWWDYRDWSATNHVPAVVGSWPAPFIAGYEGSRRPVAVECMGGGESCERVREALRGVGTLITADPPDGAIRVLVGPWSRLRSDPAAVQLEAGPEVSGVFGGFDLQEDGYVLIGLDRFGEAAAGFGPDAGLVAATRRYEGPPVWMVTGGTAAGVREAAGLLDAAKLRNHYAVASEDGEETALPVAEAP
jgi:hypothetical protein